MVSICFKFLLISVVFLPLCYSKAVSNQQVSRFINNLIDVNSEIVSEEIVRPAVVEINTDENLAANNGSNGQNIDEKMNLRQKELMDHILKSLKLSGPPVISDEDKIPDDLPLVRDIQKMDLYEENLQFQNSLGEIRSKKLISVAKKCKYIVQLILDVCFL